MEPLLIYVGTLWHHVEPEQTTYTDPYCMTDEAENDFPWLDDYDMVSDTE